MTNSQYIGTSRTGELQRVIRSWQAWVVFLAGTFVVLALYYEHFAPPLLPLLLFFTLLLARRFASRSTDVSMIDPRQSWHTDCYLKSSDSGARWKSGTLWSSGHAIGWSPEKLFSHQYEPTNMSFVIGRVISNRRPKGREGWSFNADLMTVVDCVGASGDIFSIAIRHEAVGILVATLDGERSLLPGN